MLSSGDGVSLHFLLSFCSLFSIYCAIKKEGVTFEKWLFLRNECGHALVCVCVCMCVCVCVCLVCVCASRNMHSNSTNTLMHNRCVHAHTHARMHTHTHTSEHAHVHAHTYTHTHTHSPANLCVIQTAFKYQRLEICSNRPLRKRGVNPFTDHCLFRTSPTPPPSLPLSFLPVHVPRLTTAELLATDSALTAQW